mgnify:FL=1|tara:strand:+ start:1110 stop:1355 length:246 start_codon:yes stop_codon:yes gene_type:complete
MKSAEEFKILHDMIAALPDKLSCNILKQFNSTIQVLETERLNFRDNVLKELIELQLNVSYMDFDLYATKQERDEYKQKLDE